MGRGGDGGGGEKEQGSDTKTGLVAEVGPSALVNGLSSEVFGGGGEE